MSNNTSKPKTLSLKKPLSWAQQAQIFTTFGKKRITQTTLESSFQLSLGVSPSKDHNETSSQSSSADKAAIQKQRQERQQRALEWLLQTFPACFNLDHPQPLKIGLFKDLIQFLEKKDRTELPSLLSLRKTLNFYTQRRQYHQALLKTLHRCDLEGKPVQEVTDKERDHAQDQIKILEKRHQQWHDKRQRSSPASSPSKNIF